MGIRHVIAGVLAVGCGKVNSADHLDAAPSAIDAADAATCDPSFAVSPSPQQNTPITFTPVTSGATYAWTFDGGAPATSTDQIPIVTFATAGDHAVMLTVTDGACTMMSTQTISLAACSATAGTQTFSYTGAMQQFAVPACIAALTIDAYGAAGGAGTTGIAGGAGGRATGNPAVTGGQLLYIMVGGQGVSETTGSATGYPGGFNGGGGVHEYIGWTAQAEGESGTGGGASDVRLGGTTLADRIIVAGGGAGGAGTAGGAGGGTSGVTAANGTGTGVGGGGGSQLAGGTASSPSANYPNTPGTLGVGGDAYRDGSSSGGGGGGYYGGGGGDFAGGGGGSSFIGGLTAATTVAGVRSGDGTVVLTWH